MDSMYFGDKLKKEREKRGWSQEYLAEKIYVSRQSVSKWETNKNYPSIEIIIHLSDLFNITIDELLRSDDKLTKKVIQDSKQKFSILSLLVKVIIGILFSFGGVAYVMLVPDANYLMVVAPYLIAAMLVGWAIADIIKYKNSEIIPD